MKTFARLALGCAALCMPLMVAAAPALVTGITATMQGGKVLVTWAPVNDPSIVSYRIYTSHASILSNSGLYDDYNTVEGSVNSFTIPETPTVPTLYVSVLAVNAQGEESPYFAEEANVSINGATPSTPTTVPSVPTTTQTSSAAVTTSVPTTQLPQGDSVLRLLGVQTLSATGVQLTFSTTVSVDPTLATHAFDIESASGKTLRVVRMKIQGNVVTLDTTPQERGTVYVMIINQGVTGITIAGAQIPYDMTQAPTLFTGDPSGVAPGTTQPVAAASSAASSVSTATDPVGSDVKNMQMRAQAEKKGFYTVQIAWEKPANDTLTGYRVAQSTDEGGTFGELSTMKATTNGVTVPHVPAGSYGLLVRAVYADGTVSKGVFKAIDLPGKAPVTPIQGSVLPTKGTHGKLPQSGPELYLVILMTGAIAGYRVMRHRSLRAA